MAGDDPKSSKDNKENMFNGSLDEFEFTDEDLLNVMYSPDPNLSDLNLPPLDLPHTPFMEINETQLIHELSLSISDECNDDDYLINWDMLEQSHENLDNNIDLNIQGDIANDSNVSETTTRLEVSNLVFGNTSGPNFEVGGPSTTHIPVTPAIFDGSFVCTCCTLLRELVHTNGQDTNRLTIYGGIGFFCHAILETQRYVGVIQRHYQTLYLKDLMMEAVKNFVEEYCSQTQDSGFSLVDDTNSSFYQTMIANTISNQSLMVPVPLRNDVPKSLPTPDEAINVPMSFPTPDEAIKVLHMPPLDEPTTSSPKGKGQKKSRLSLQRERTGKMTLKDINMYFHDPIKTAARSLSLCPTVLKKICRKGGLMRWPHRKIKSLEDRIARMKNVVRMTKNDEVRSRAQQEIENLQKKIADFCSDILNNYK